MDHKTAYAISKSISKALERLHHASHPMQGLFVNAEEARKELRSIDPSALPNDLNADFITVCSILQDKKIDTEASARATLLMQGIRIHANRVLPDIEVSRNG